MKRIKSFYDLDVLKNYVTLIWNNPDSKLESDDYTISWIEDLVYLYDEDNTTPILIQYNNGKSEAQVFLHEIIYKNEQTV